jgi:hypothetical protein
MALMEKPHRGDESDSFPLASLCLAPISYLSYMLNDTHLDVKEFRILDADSWLLHFP